MVINKTLEADKITELLPLSWEQYKQYKIENKSDFPVLIWVGTSNPYIGNESFTIDPKSHESRFFKGQQIKAFCLKSADITLTVK